MNPTICPTCHSPIPAHAPGGFCPACLLRDAEEPAPTGRGAPSLEEIATGFPQWEIVRLIGQGGMGFVYQVRQPGLDRTVALKILSPELGRDPTFAERFAREARALGKLNHPNIVAVYEHGESGGFFYLLMEFVDGVNLRQAMRAGRFTPEQALAIVPGICDALQAAHSQGVWHRDIKPENILLDRDGGVKIADFGIARMVGDPHGNFTLTMTGGALGSASYMAPEQHENPRDVDHRADIYSLGVVIYEMLTGELPLGRFPAPSQRAAVSNHIDKIVFRTLEKERELRQQSANEVKTDMQGAAKIAADTKRSAAPVSTEPRFSRLAIVGFVWAVAGMLHFLFPEMGYRMVSEFVPIAMLWIGLSSLPGSMILGWLAVWQIRRSDGRIRGLALAVCDGLIFPIFIINGLLIRAVSASTRPTGLVILALIVAATLLNWLILRSVWRSVAKDTPNRLMDVTMSWLAFGMAVVTVSILVVAPEMRTGANARQETARPRSVVPPRPAPAKNRSVPPDVETIVHWTIPIPVAGGKGDRSVELKGRLWAGAVSGDEYTSLTIAVGDRNWFPVCMIIGRGSNKSIQSHSDGKVLTGEAGIGNRKVEYAIGHPEKVKLNGMEMDLRRGRVFMIRPDGTPRQLAMFPPDFIPENELDGFAAGIPKEQFSHGIPAPVDRIQLEAVKQPEDDVPQVQEAMSAIIQAARERNARVFQNGFSKSFKETLKKEGESLDNFGDFGQSRFISANKLDATNAEVVVEANDGSQRRFTFRMVLEEGAWKLNELGSKP
ncbi:MAG: protein kinase [Verrucomicrobiota bacterium]